MSEINYDEQIKHQQARLAEVTALKIKLEGAIEMLQLLKAEAERKVEEVVSEAKVLEAEVVEKVKEVL
jgi:DNA-directed RNA polymerase specialized sigma54-like protein